MFLEQFDVSLIITSDLPVVIWVKSNVYKMFTQRLGNDINVLWSFNLSNMSTGLRPQIDKILDNEKFQNCKDLP